MISDLCEAGYVPFRNAHQSREAATVDVTSPLHSSTRFEGHRSTSVTGQAAQNPLDLQLCK
jgi:hypothetical protein